MTDAPPLFHLSGNTVRTNGSVSIAQLKNIIATLDELAEQGDLESVDSLRLDTRIEVSEGFKQWADIQESLGEGHLDLTLPVDQLVFTDTNEGTLVSDKQDGTAFGFLPPRGDQ